MQFVQSLRKYIWTSINIHSDFDQPFASFSENKLYPIPNRWPWGYSTIKCKTLPYLCMREKEGEEHLKTVSPHTNPSLDPEGGCYIFCSLVFAHKCLECWTGHCFPSMTVEEEEKEKKTSFHYRWRNVYQ